MACDSAAADNGELVSPEMQAQLRLLEDMTDVDIDLGDVPEVRDWSAAVQGRYYRPVKKPYSLCLDEDVVAWFKAAGDGYQTRINAALREYMLSHGKAGG